MRRKSVQESILSLSRWLVPLLFVLPFLPDRFISFNYTGLINDVRYRALFFVSEIPCGIIEFLLLYQAGAGLIPHWGKQCLASVLLMILMVFTPYQKEESTLSSLHLILAWCFMILLNWMLYETGWTHPEIRIPYLIGTFLSAMISLTCNSICGLAEIVYACMVNHSLRILVSERT